MTFNTDELEHDITTLRGEMELEDYMEQREQELSLKIAQEKYETDDEVCRTCSYYYHDGFCTYHLSYWNPEHTCPKWTDEELELDYDFLYRRCKDYIRICEMYNRHEELKKKHPGKLHWESTSNEDFFLQCCLNDMKRELSLWTLKK